MLGSHDSFTFLNTSNKIINLFSIFWRCQTKTIEEQYELGTRVFDIRVIDCSKNKCHYWKVGHGIAKVKQTFNSLEDICIYFKEKYPDVYIRIMLEYGAKKIHIRTRFENEATKIIKEYGDMIWSIYIKNPWICFYKGLEFNDIKDTCCHLFNWHINKDLLTNIKNIEFSSYSIKRWSKKHNPATITKEMIDDKTTLYFMDYVGVYPKK